MNLSAAISDLLLYHDCVIIPGFGGFISSYAPATIHPTQHTFIPPSKAVMFNRSLNSNDGLLADHMSRKFRIGFSEANQFIAKQAAEFEQLLSAGKKVSIQNVGELYRDVEKNICFNPDKGNNFLIDSFGLAEFQSPAIKRFEDVSRIINLPQADKTESKQSSRKALKRFLVAAAVIPFTIALSYLPFHTGLVKKDLSDLNPFKGQEHSSSYSARKHKVKEMSVSEISFNHTLPASADPEPVAIADATPAKAEVPAPTAPVKADNVTGYKFYLVAGCFQSIENAQKYIQELGSKGVSAELIGQAPGGLYRVGAGKFNDRAEAVKVQNQLKTQNLSGWILAN